MRRWGINPGVALPVCLAAISFSSPISSQELQPIQPPNLTFWEGTARCAAYFRFSSELLEIDALERKDELAEVVKSLATEHSRMSSLLSVMSVDLAMNAEVVLKEHVISLVQNTVENYRYFYIRYAHDHPRNWRDGELSEIDLEVCSKLAEIALEQGYSNE